MIKLNKGDIIKNEELVEIFKCSTQGGMRRSHKTNTLVLVSNHIKSIYSDRWYGKELHYTGMGSTGNQTLGAQNKLFMKVMLMELKFTCLRCLSLESIHTKEL